MENSRDLMLHFIQGMDLLSHPPRDLQSYQPLRVGIHSAKLQIRLSGPSPIMCDSLRQRQGMPRPSVPATGNTSVGKKRGIVHEEHDRERLQTCPSIKRPFMEAYVEIPASTRARLASPTLTSRGSVSNTATLRMVDLGEKLIPALMELTKEHPQCWRLGFLKLKVHHDASADLYTPELEGSVIDRTQSDLEMFHSTSFLLEQVGRNNLAKKFDRENILSARADPNIVDTFTFPAFDQNPEHVDTAHLPEHLTKCLASKRPMSSFSYLIAPAETLNERSRVGLPSFRTLQCGTRLSRTRNNKMPGIHTSWGYVSTSSGSFAAIHIEDAGLGSINILHAGMPKLWLIIAPRHSSKLESQLALLFPHLRRSCSQWVRHANVLLLPPLLDAWEIEYTVVRCNPGEMVITMPNAYHEVWNEGANIAEALNFAPDGWSAPNNYRYGVEGKKRAGRACGCAIAKEDLEFNDDIGGDGKQQ